MSIEAMKRWLEALELCLIWVEHSEHIAACDDCITEIRQAIEQAQKPKCNPHPKAPHGFNRNASHANDRYTCECEGWDAYDAGYQAGIEAALEKL
jgi:dienelactone hydrolase